MQSYWFRVLIQAVHIVATGFEVVKRVVLLYFSSILIGVLGWGSLTVPSSCKFLAAPIRLMDRATYIQ